jgi:DNA-binding CsgD family transcriptional regulator
VLDDVHATGTTALTDLRRLVEVLRDPRGVGDDAAITAIEPGSLPAALGAAVDTARRTGLTVEAEIDEADLVGEGLSNAEIGERLHIGVTTVKTHITALMAKTGSPNRVRLALVAPRR